VGLPEYFRDGLVGNRPVGASRLLEAEHFGAETFQAVARFIHELADERGGVEGTHVLTTRWTSSSPIIPTGTRMVPTKQARRSGDQVAGVGSISSGSIE